MFKRILVPVDGSKLSKKASNYAIELAKKLGSTVIITNIMSQMSEMSYEEQEIQSKEFIKEIVDNAVKENVKVESMTLFGSPTHDIVTIARKSEADLIVMGTHGMTSSNSKLMGSFAKSTLEFVDLPILLIK